MYIKKETIKEILSIIKELSSKYDGAFSYELIAGEIKVNLDVVEYSNMLLTKELPKNNPLLLVGSKTYKVNKFNNKGVKNERIRIKKTRS
jgi:hypothetical protein